MVIEDIRYQLSQFISFDNVKLSFEIKDRKGEIFFSNGLITKAIFDSKQDMDAFAELKDLDGQINIQVGIGEPAPEDTLNKSIDEIIHEISLKAETKFNTESVSSAVSDSLSANANQNSLALVDKIGESLATIVGVEGVLAMKPNGEVLFAKGVDDTDFESADSIFLYNQSREFGDMFSFSNLKSTICEANNYKKIIIDNKGILYSMKLSSSVQSLKTQTEAVKLLENS